jgi:copper chaperone CopZ
MGKFDLTADIQGMSCAHCSAAVTEAIKGVPGVSGVEVKLKENKAYIKGNPNKDAVIEAVKEAGFGAKI